MSSDGQHPQGQYPQGQAPLPNPPPHGLDLTDIQAGPLVQLAKRNEVFIFFTIADVEEFRGNLKEIIRFITTTADAQRGRSKIARVRAATQDALVPLAGTNIAFSANGLRKLGFDPAGLNDASFTAGQLKQAQALGDRGQGDGDDFVPDWLPQFKQEIHGIIAIAGASAETVEGRLKDVIDALGNSITQVHRVDGKARPPPHKGKEHFGFEDGVSQPLVTGTGIPLPGQTVVDPGVLLIGQQGDPIPDRAEWARNGSILVYRHLKQLVPEFHQFVEDAARGLGVGTDIPIASAFLAARMVGRWHSGCPLNLSIGVDNPEIGRDKMRNNLVDFTKPDPESQEICPFAAHVRKTGPRTDISDSGRKSHSIMRAGITFGDEVSEDEKTNRTTSQDRGLAFVSYQSTLSSGFEFMQKKWCNAPHFPPKEKEPGFDPLVGQNSGGPRQMSGVNPQNASEILQMPFDFVLSQGGEYFLAPSMTTIRTIANVN